MNDIKSLCNWSPASRVETSRGPRMLRVAPASPEFWSAWRADKAGLQAAGVSCRPGRGRDWQALWWLPVNDEAPVAVDEMVSYAPCEIPEALPLTPGERWSLEQRAIFAWFQSGKGNLEVEARAGTGKTTTIKQAFSYAPESEMLYAVFNRKNQKEAEEKITDSRVTVKTLHGLGFSYILSVWPGTKPDDAVEDDRIRAACPGIPDEALGAVLKLVAVAKNLFLTVPPVEHLAAAGAERGVFCPIQTAAGTDEFPLPLLAEIARKALELALVRDEAKRISFNDMVWLPCAAGFVRPRFDLVVVDEAQDMNVPQLFMARRACRKGGRICIVGDPRQAIYGFRGAASDGMGMMQKELTAGKLGLTTTYRCPKSVVALAAALVPDYHAAPEAPEGVVVECSDAQLFERLQVGDAVLSRVNAPLMALCLALLRKGTPARIEGRDIGKQLVGMVRKLNAKSVPDFLRKLAAWAEKQTRRVSVGKGGAGRAAIVEDQRATLAAVAEGCANVAEIESRLLSLFQDSDENARPAVVLSSTHKAKGLEWDRVALLSSTFKRSRKGQTEAERLEEENIYYVALTRAKQELLLVS